MSSREDEKARRRRERLERERGNERAAGVRKRLRLAGAGVLGVAALVVVAVVVLADPDGDSDLAAGAARSGSSTAAPTQNVADFNAAIAAAGCKATTHADEGQAHLASETATFGGYKTNPPTSGTHAPAPAEDGIYDPGNAPTKESLVHSLEHGRIVVHYRPGTPPERIAQLEGLLGEPLKGVDGYHQTLVQNTTDMTAAVVATAWTQSLTCPALTDASFDAVRAFRERYVDKAPELVP